MAVSKRVRYEVLRRDGHACRYCGAMAPEVKLTIDHVVPVALGGSDDPSNLVTACAECNAGKTSTSPDAQVVADVAADAIRWGRAMQAAASVIEARGVVDRSLFSEFRAIWEHPTYEHKGNEVLLNGPLPDGWEVSLMDVHKAGVPIPVINEAARVVSALRWAPRDPFAYCMGILHNKQREIANEAARMIESGEA